MYIDKATLWACVATIAVLIAVLINDFVMIFFAKAV